MAGNAERIVRFGNFEANLASGELSRGGLKLRLSGQPFEILAALLEEPGAVVTREQLRERLWPGDTFVDYDHSLNAAINKLREALGDSADTPRFVETLPRRGYRFVGQVEPPAATVSAPAPASAVDPAPSPAPTTRFSRGSGRRWLAAGLLAVAALIGGLWLRSRASARPIESLAVLPFTNLSGDVEQDYFADGVTEAVIGRLSQVGALRVISRTSVMPYKGSKTALPQIARELNVDAVVEGSVQRAGGRVRISANLVAAATDRSLWTGAYEHELKDVLKVQAEVAGAIVDGIRVRVTPDERLRLDRSRTIDPQAYQEYLLGLADLNRSTSWFAQRAAQHFHRALEKDPSYALAWVGLAEAETFGYPPLATMALAREAAQKALALDPNLASAHAALGLVRTFADWDWKGAESSFLRAIELNPSDAEARYRYSHLLAAQGRFEAAIAQCRAALDLDPRSSNIGHYLGRIYLFARQEDRAIEQLRRTIAIDPASYWAHFFLAKAYEQKGAYAEAMAEWERASALMGVSATTIVEGKKAFETAGYRAAVRFALARLQEAEEIGPLPSSGVAQRLAWLGDKDEAIRWLTRAYESHTRDLIYLNVEPSFDSVRGDPRFQAIVRLVGLPPPAPRT